MSSSKIRDLILIGGGHSHVYVLEKWAQQPIENTQLTLISPYRQHPYSGMLPGLISGHYKASDTHIDLVRLCAVAKVRFIHGKVNGVTLSDNPSVPHRVHCAPPPEGPSAEGTQSPLAEGSQYPLAEGSQYPLAEGSLYPLAEGSIPADVISINAGVVPDLSVAGVTRQVIPVKPIAGFYSHWCQLVNYLQTHTLTAPLNIGVVGGGAAGVELLLAIQYAFGKNKSIHSPVKFHLIQRGAEVAEDYPLKVQKLLKEKFQQTKIKIHHNFDVKCVDQDLCEPAGNSAKFDNKILYAQDGRQLTLQTVFWCTNACAELWPQEAGLATDAQGFIQVNEYLQSLNVKSVFASGDIANFTPKPLPKAGVFAVRQGPVLAENLQRFLLNQPLQTYTAQQQFLSLLACGDKYAIACRGSLSVGGRWVWYWKKYLDSRFIKRFNI